MSNLREQMKLIPPAAWIIGIVSYFGFATLAWFVTIPLDQRLSGWPYAGRVAFSAGIPLFFLIYVLLVGYV